MTFPTTSHSIWQHLVRFEKESGPSRGELGMSGTPVPALETGGPPPVSNNAGSRHSENNSPASRSAAGHPSLLISNSRILSMPFQRTGYPVIHPPERR